MKNGVMTPQERTALLKYLFSGKICALRQSYKELRVALPNDDGVKAVWETVHITKELLTTSSNLCCLLEIQSRFDRSNDTDFYLFLANELAILARNLLNSCDPLENAVAAKDIELLAKILSNLESV